MIYPEHTLHIQWVKCLLNLAAEINIREVSEKERVLQLGLNPLDFSNINIKQIEMHMKQMSCKSLSLMDPIGLKTRVVFQIYNYGEQSIKGNFSFVKIKKKIFS